MDYKDLIMYQIYPRSYYDSNNDGIGDIPGITLKLDYIASLGINAIWLSPFFTSPMKDFGYDISDYCDVDPMFGTLDDYRKMLDKAHSLGIKVIIDQVLSHTSDKHPWFVESRSSRDNSKADWYVWTDMEADGTPPNNWLSIFGGPAWQFDTSRGQYYMHNFLVSQPDLNFHNPEVQDAVLAVSEFWLDQGTDGFRFDTANFYFCDKELRSNPPWEDQSVHGRGGGTGFNPYAMQAHKYDKTQPENIEFFKRMRKLADSKGAVVMVGEIGSDYGLQTIAEYTSGDDKLQTCYGFDLMEEDCDGKYIYEVLQNAKKYLDDSYICWATSNHDVVRVASRWKVDGVAPEQISKFAMALLTANRGMPCFYQGEELGLGEADVPYELLQDPYGIEFWPNFKGRDGCRTPMVWTSESGGGFNTSGQSWLPVVEDHLAHSVAALEGKQGTTLDCIRKLCGLRHSSSALKYGEIAVASADEAGNVFSILREYEDERIIFIFNGSAAVDKVELAFACGLNQLWSEFDFGVEIVEDKIVLEPYGVYVGLSRV